jgi:hypothetical protein
MTLLWSETLVSSQPGFSPNSLASHFRLSTVYKNQSIVLIINLTALFLTSNCETTVGRN